MGTLPPTTLVRSSFPHMAHAGRRFSAHFITSIVARVPRDSLDRRGEFGDLEIGACYVAGRYPVRTTATTGRASASSAGTA